MGTIEVAPAGLCKLREMSPLPNLRNSTGLSVEDMREHWHVDLDRLNAQLLAAVNSDAGCAFWLREQVI